VHAPVVWPSQARGMATATAGDVLSKYADHDPSTRAAWISGDLAEETRLPRELVLRLYDMWFARDRPFFDKVSEDGVLAPKDLVEVIRTLKIDDILLCNSVAGVISEGRPVTFDVFIRGYAALNSRTLREALPFAFKVFDLDGDGLLGPNEFKLVLEANLKHQGLDAAAVNRVLATDQGPKTGMDRDQFRYFASQVHMHAHACACTHICTFVHANVRSHAHALLRVAVFGDGARVVWLPAQGGPSKVVSTVASK